VLTYGKIAALIGLGKNYRLIGYALHNVSDDSGVPWHRVVNRHGKISYAPTRRGYDHVQRILLEQEGICFDRNGRIDLSRYGFQKRKLNK
jgi:methylated-DNA-protein-cysteine methyltransferase related protein